MIRNMLCAAALIGAVAAPALAVAGSNPQRTLYFMSGGQMTSMELSDAKAAWFTQRAQKLAPGTLVMTADGNLYVLQDAKMDDGRMISDMLTH